jgi:cytochrome d ubiquinol oxidase subunit I
MDVLFARGQMGLSLAFHIVFAVAGIAMPALMVIAEAIWHRTGDDAYYNLAKNWSKGTAVLFAVGAVSGTVLSFELGLLFPRFMEQAGPIIGMPFSLEGFAFFTEAIFLGIYLYGWERVSRGMHLTSGIIVALSGLASAAFVLIANAWMNAPRGFRMSGGNLVDVDPIEAMRTPFAAHEILHMVVAAYMATGFAVAGIHAFAILRGSATQFHRRALTIALLLAIPFALVQPIVGDFAGKQVARYQPLKLAAIERLEKTQHRAPIRIGPVAVPGALSWMAYGDANAVVRGLEEWPRRDWPHPIVRTSFQAMVALGMWMAAVSAYAILLCVRRRPWPDDRLLLRLMVLTAPMGFVAIELGWIVTELGRQPWIIYGVMRTAESVTPMRGLAVPFTIFMAMYVLLSITVIAILRSQVRATMEPGE